MNGGDFEKGNPELSPEKMRDPEHYPAEMPISIPGWATEISFPVTSEDIVEKHGKE